MVSTRGSSEIATLVTVSLVSITSRRSRIHVADDKAALRVLRRADPHFSQSSALGTILPLCGFGDQLVGNAGNLTH